METEKNDHGICARRLLLYTLYIMNESPVEMAAYVRYAGIAQLVAQLIRNQ